MNMKQLAWAIMAVGVLVADSGILAEAAGGRGDGARRGGSGWHAGSPRVDGGWPAGNSWQGSAWHTGSPRWAGDFYSGGERWHGGTRVFIGGGLGWWGPGWWGAPYRYYVAPPVVVQSPPAEYIQTPPPPAQDYWYYCQSAGAYYPYVKDCPGGWMQVVPPPTLPDQ